MVIERFVDAACFDLVGQNPCSGCDSQSMVRSGKERGFCLFSLDSLNGGSGTSSRFTSHLSLQSFRQGKCKERKGNVRSMIRRCSTESKSGTMTFIHSLIWMPSSFHTPFPYSYSWIRANQSVSKTSFHRPSEWVFIPKTRTKENCFIKTLSNQTQLSFFSDCFSSTRVR